MAFPLNDPRRKTLHLEEELAVNNNIYSVIPLPINTHERFYVRTPWPTNILAGIFVANSGTDMQITMHAVYCTFTVEQSGSILTARIHKE